MENLVLEIHNFRSSLVDMIHYILERRLEGHRFIDPNTISNDKLGPPQCNPSARMTLIR